MQTKSDFKSLSLSTSALIFAVTVSITGIIVTVLLGSICLDIVHAIRKQNNIALQMSLVDRILEDQGAQMEKALLFKLDEGKGNPFKEKYKTAIPIHEIVSLAKENQSLRKEIQRMDEIQKEFHEKCGNWLATGDIRSSSMFLSGKDVVTVYRDSSEQWSKLIKILKTELDKTTNEVSHKALIAIIIVTLSIVLNFFLLLFLLNYYTKYVSSKLKVILDSASTLASNQPVSEKLEASDELKKLENSLLALSDELEASRARKQEFLALVSHDLRSPLTMLRMTLEMMHKEVYGKITSQTKSDLIPQIKKIENLITFVSDLLDIEKIDAGLFHLDSQSINLIALIHHIKNRVLSNSSYNEAVIEVNTESEEVIVTWDKERLESSLERIITACLDYTSGVLHIKVSILKSGGPVQISIECSNSAMQFISPDMVFDRFSQSNQSTKELYSEYRQSLCLARKLIQLNGGDLEFAPVPGLSRFNLTIPLPGQDSSEGDVYETE